MYTASVAHSALLEGLLACSRVFSQDIPVLRLMSRGVPEGVPEGVSKGPEEPLRQESGKNLSK